MKIPDELKVIKRTQEMSTTTKEFKILIGSIRRAIRDHRTTLDVNSGVFNFNPSSDVIHVHNKKYLVSQQRIFKTLVQV